MKYRIPKAKVKKALKLVAVSTLIMGTMLAPEVALAKTNILTGAVESVASFVKAIGQLGRIAVSVAGFCIGAYGLWQLKPGNNSNTPKGAAWGMVGIGILMMSAPWLFNSASTDLGNDQGAQIEYDSTFGN